MFEVIDDSALIKKYQMKLTEEIKTHLCNETYNDIGFLGGSIYQKVYSSDKHNIWCSMAEDLPDGSRYWNPFGIGNPQNTKHLTPIVEINIPLILDRRIGGTFLKDNSGNIYLGHRGKIGGGKEGIGKSLFFEKYTGKVVDALDGDKNNKIAIISPIDDKHLIINIKRFIFAVNQIKGNNNDLSFSPENIFRDSYIQECTITPCMEHAQVVNALAQELSTKGFIPFNSKEIDIYTLNNDGSYETIFEIKSKIDTQSIYTGIGQLYYHSARTKKARKILVVPNSITSKMRSTIQLIGIAVLTYKINGNHIEFEKTII